MKRELVRYGAMRAVTIAAFAVPLGLAGCGNPGDDRRSGDAAPQAVPLTAGEERADIAPPGEHPAILRSGPQVPVSLPAGFTLYPGAKVVTSTTVQRGGEQRSLVVFETSDPPERVIGFYRAQAKAAGMSITLDLGGADQASIGGALAGGRTLAISVRREGVGSRVEFAVG